MKKFDLATIAAAIAFVVGIALPPATPALAQPGWLVCGKTAVTPAGAIGILYKMRARDESDNLMCKKFLKEASDKIELDKKLSKLQWTTLDNRDCEEAGFTYKSANSEHDMCKHMQDKTPYFVQMSKANNSTAYTKQ